MLQRLSEERTVLVQSSLYPHAGYQSRVRLLTHDSLADQRYAGAAIVLAPALSAYPLNSREVNSLAQRQAILKTTAGLVVVR